MKLYDLAGSEDDRRTSPYCWRIRFALAHKQLGFDPVPWRAEEKGVIAFSGQRQVPILVDKGTTVVDSWRIAEYLESTYSGTPLLFASKEGKGGVMFIVHWLDHVVYPIMMQIVCADALEVAHDMDKAFFRDKWEYVHGMALEEFGGAIKVKHFQEALEPMRLILQEQPFLGGASPNYADLAVAGNFAWARAVSTIQLLSPADPIFNWRAQMFDRFHAVVAPTIGFQQSLTAATEHTEES